jgi:hypothetical protein
LNNDEADASNFVGVVILDEAKDLAEVPKIGVPQLIRSHRN